MGVTTPKERFWAKVTKGPGCWVWTAAVSKGYGVFWFQGRTVPAHRWCFEHHNGPVPDDVIVRHHCDNTLCVRPAHLAAGTHGDNIQDRDRRERQARGARNGRAKLNPNQVRSIRTRHQLGGTLSRLAREFGVSRRAVRMIIDRKTWTHI